MSDEREKLKNKRFLCSKEATLYFNVSRVTLYDWEKKGLIKCFRTSTGPEGYFGHRRFDIESFGHNEVFDSISKPELPKNENENKGGVCYCRVSTSKQLDDLERQVEFIKLQYPSFTIIKDVGSGINYKKKGLLKLLKGVIDGLFKTVVVSSKDRLTRFGFELFEWLFSQYNTTIVVLNKEYETADQELSNDILTIIHVFACRANGKRRYLDRSKTQGIKNNDEQIKEDE